MPKTPNLEIDLSLSGHVQMQETVRKGFEKVDGHVGIAADIVSAGGNITIPAGSTLSQALQIIVDAADPSGG